MVDPRVVMRSIRVYCMYLFQETEVLQVGLRKAYKGNPALFCDQVMSSIFEHYHRVMS